MKTKALKTGLTIELKYNILTFADDVALMTENKNDLMTLSKALTNYTKKGGLEVSEEKTKHLAQGRNNEQIDSDCYLKVNVLNFQLPWVMGLKKTKILTLLFLNENKCCFTKASEE